VILHGAPTAAAGNSSGGVAARGQGRRLLQEPHDAHDAHDRQAAAVADPAKGDTDVDPYAGMDAEHKRRAQIRHEHEEFQKKHAGHERMHAEMLMVLFGTMILSQILLVLWKKHYFASYQTVTLLGMWLIPPYLATILHFNRLLAAWALFSIVTFYVSYKASRQPMDTGTPRRVYTYFTVLYKLSYFTTFTGYFMALADFLGVGVIIQALFTTKKHPLMSWGLLAMFYGLYFGVLIRDFAEISAETMASYIGYYNKDKTMPTKHLGVDVCAICGEHTKGDEVEKVVKLSCDHRFHEFCIRGWTIVGKKDVCPYCGEKVQFQQLYKQPWSLERQDVLFSQLLDLIRYLVVWQPAIITLVKAINHGLGLQ